MRTPTDAWIASRLGIPLEKLSVGALTDYQMDRFRQQLAYAAEKSPFYAERLKGYDPGSIRTPEDIKKLPVTSEEDLAGNENSFLCIPPGSVERIFTVPTTGTHGKQKRIFFTAGDLAPSVEFYYHAFLTFIRPGDRLLVMMGGTSRAGVGDIIDRSLSPIGVITEVYGAVTDLGDALRAVKEFSPDIIVAIPYQAAALAEYSRLNGIPEGIRCVLLSADDVPEAIRRRISSLWGAEVYSHYGMTETGLAGGVDCCAHRGYHLRSCDMYAEILDAGSDGFGELAITPFGREAMPLLRYRTGDIARISTERCPCGGVLPRLETIRGRLSNSFVIRGRHIFLSQIEEAVYCLPSAVDLECSAEEEGILLTVRTLAGGEGIDKKALEERIYQDVLPEGTRLTITEEKISGLSAERSPKKRLGEGRHE